MSVAMIQETFPMTVAEEEVLNERELLVRVESGLMMDSTDSVRYIILPVPPHAVTATTP